MLFHVHTRAYSTLPVILSAISHFHSRHFLDTPTVSRAVSRSLDGAKRLFGAPSVTRNIITQEILRSMISLTFVSSISFTVFRTIWRVAIEFYGLLRYSEVSQLLFSDIIWTDLSFDIFIKKSKTDQTCKVCRTHTWTYRCHMHGTSMGTIHLSRNLTDAHAYT